MINLLAVIVIYNKEIEKSKTINSLLSAVNLNRHGIFKQFKLIIYDNSTYKQKISIEFPFKYQYTHNKKNEGVAKAYNFACEVAMKENYEWIMLLDQDSTLHENYFTMISDALEKNHNNIDIVAFVPKIFHGKTMFSPAKVLWGGVHRHIDVSHVGVYPKEIMSIGSCTVVRSSFIFEIGDFNEEFWLDCLDRWLFKTIYSRGKKVFVIDAFVTHELSVLDFNNLMNEKRYINQLKYETIFMKSYKSTFENIFFLVRLLRRAFVLLIVAKNKKYFKITLNQLKTILMKNVQ